MPLLRKLIATFSRAARDAELNEEIESHLAMLEAAYVSRGMSPREAREAARRDFGGVEQTKQIYREQRGVALLENLFQDARLSLRSLRKTPAFAAIAIASLAVGIGANTSMFTLIRALKFRTLPVPQPEQLVQVRTFSPEYKSFGDNFSFPFVTELARTGIFASTAGMFPTSAALFADHRTTQTPVELVTADYFRTLRTEPMLGRLLGPSDMQHPGADAVCVISYSLWQFRFGGRSDILDRSIKLSGIPFRIVGVTEKRFEGSVLYWPHDIEIPVSMTSQFMHDFPWQTANSTFLYVFARMQPAMTVAASDARLKVVGPQVGAKIRDPKNPDATARWNRFSVVPASKGPGLMEDKSMQVFLLSGVVLLTLLIACANIAGLLLARATSQERETAVQISLGAPKKRIIQRYLVESLLLASIGGAIGFIASHWITKLFTYELQIGYLDLTLDWKMFLFSLTACIGTALLFGLIPGWQASRVDARFVGLRNQGTARSTTRRQSLFRQTLVSVQVALATVLMVGCALFLRSMQNIQTVKLGFDPRQVLLIDTDPSQAGKSDASSLAVYRRILERVRTLPAVESATLGYGIPLSGQTFNGSIQSSRITDTKVPDRIIPSAIVADNLFATLHIPILRGRDFNASDFHRNRSVIVNREFLSYYRLGHHVLGRQIKLDPAEPPLEIIGIVGDTKMQSVREETGPAMFFPLTDDVKGSLQLLVRPRARASVLPAIREAVHEIDPQSSVTSEARLDDKISAESFDQRAIASLCSAFSGFALLLSCMGLYGIAAYSISRRTQEIGIRVALGAVRRDLATLFLRESCWITALGLVAGIPVALALASLIRNLLFGIEPADPLTLIIASVVLTAICILAAALPLPKAFGVDPAVALRGE